MFKKKTKVMEPPPQRVSLMEIASTSGSLMSPTTVKKAAGNGGLTPNSVDKTVAETPSPTSSSSDAGNGLTSSGSRRISPRSLAVFQSITEEDTGVAAGTATKPFDEEVDDSLISAEQDFENIWATTEEQKKYLAADLPKTTEDDRAYLLSRMMSSIPSPERVKLMTPQKTKQTQAPPVALPFLAPGSPSPMSLSSTNNNQNRLLPPESPDGSPPCPPPNQETNDGKQLAPIVEEQLAEIERVALSRATTPTQPSANDGVPSPGASPIPQSSPSITMIEDDDDEEQKPGPKIDDNDNVLTPFNPTVNASPDSISYANKTLKPNALFGEDDEMIMDDDENKENIPPLIDKEHQAIKQGHHDDASYISIEEEEELLSDATPEDEPGKLIPTPLWKKMESENGSRGSSEEELPFDCINDTTISDYHAYYQGAMRKMKNRRDYYHHDESEYDYMEEGRRNRFPVFRKAFRSPRKNRTPYPYPLDASNRIESLKSLRKSSTIHPPEIIEFESKSVGGSSRRDRDAFEDEPLASLTLAKGGDPEYDALNRSLVDLPKFPIGSPRKSKNGGNSISDIKRGRRRKLKLYGLLVFLIVGLLLVILGSTGNLNKDDVNWKDGPAGQLSPYDDDATDAPVYNSTSNLFEGSEIVACTNAKPITELERTYFGSTWKAFWDSRINTCGDQMSTGYSIWYSFTTNTSQLVEASTCGNADFDTQITVLKGSCAEYLMCVSFNDQACGDQSRVTWYAEAGHVYYLMISGYREASGTFGLTLKETSNTDDCLTAEGPLEPHVVVAGTTAGAKHTENPPACGDVDVSSPGVWYEVGNVTGFYRAEVLRGLTDFQGQVAVYRSMDEEDLGCGALLCDKASSTGSVTWLAEGKETYFLFVNGKNGTKGDFDLFFGLRVPSACSHATKLDANTVGYLASTVGSNPQNVESCGYTGYHTAPGLWFSVEGTGEILEVSTCGSIRDLDTQISVFGNGCDSLECIGGSGQDYPCGDNGSVSWKTQMGETYHIFVSGRSSREGEFVLDIKEVSRLNGYSCEASLALDVGTTTFRSSTIDAPSQKVALCDGSGTTRGVWHEITGNGKTLTFSVCGEDTDFEARISLYTGGCGELSCVANTQSRCGGRDEIKITTHVGQTYYVFVHGVDSVALGNYRLGIDEGPINDACELAPTLDLSPARYFGSTLSARVSPSIECAESESSSIALWYKVLGTGQTATFSTCSVMTDFNTDITVFSGSCSMLWCVGNAADNSCGFQSSTTFQTIEGEVYYVRVGGNSTEDVGQFVMDVTDLSPFFNGN